MKSGHEIRTALVSGLVMGIIVLGFAGRFAMAGIALATGRELNLTARGLMEVAAGGAIVGLVGAVLLVLSRRVLPQKALVRGVLVGSVLFVASLLFLRPDRRVGGDVEGLRALTLSVAAGIYLIYGVAMDSLVRRVTGGHLRNGSE